MSDQDPAGSDHTYMGASTHVHWECLPEGYVLKVMQYGSPEVNLPHRLPCETGHSHPLPAHTHPLIEHSHELAEHEHPPDPMPEPGFLLLFGAGLVGLVLLRKLERR